MSKTYRAKDIEVLEGLEPVRKRPGMYIGGTEGPQGLHHLVKEILDNAIDEAMNGYADKVSVTIHKDYKSITVVDNGRGIPVDKHPKHKKSALELILTTLHAGGKFSDRNYASAGGLHGVGASVVNALSEKMVATVVRDGVRWRQEFSQGKVKSKLEKLGKARGSGTTIFFRPDPEIFRVTTFEPELLLKMIQEKAYLNKGLAITFTDDKKGKTTDFCYEEGLKSYLEERVKSENIKPIGDEIFYLERTDDRGIKNEVVFCWTDKTSARFSSYVNGINTENGGTHDDGFKSGLSKAVRNYISIHDLLPKGVKLTIDDIREGLIGLLSINIPGAVSDLQFQGQTKDKLNNPEAHQPVETTLKQFENLLNEKPSVSKTIIGRIVLAAKARQAARNAQQNVSRKVGVNHRLNLPGKLADCSSNKSAETELFIVEGDSAGGSAKQARDRKTQAILPLRGKILNAISSPESKVKANNELKDLVTALGCGFGDQLNLQKLRYGKVIILTDADADGMHIATLLMAFFYSFMQPLVTSGRLYIGLSPLYRIRSTRGGKTDDKWVYSDEEKQQVLRSIEKKVNLHVTRFKGLGEMNPKALWNTTLNPKTRKLLNIKIEDESQSDQMFKDLLGKDASPRYRLIQENAHRIEVDV